MAQITYLLGAGASANAIPTVKAIENVHSGFCKELKSFFQSNTDKFTNIGSSLHPIQIEDINQMLDQAIQMGTPDLMAKYLVETRNLNWLHWLKNLISAFIVNLEVVQKKLDYRTLAFLTYISNDGQLPENIQIISWNYDRQIESAARKLRYYRAQKGTINGFTSWPNFDDGREVTWKPFLVHINGVSGHKYDEKKMALPDANIFEIGSQGDSMISYAWEEKGNRKLFEEERIGILQRLLFDTEILIIIGYSFPFFNRIIDTAIFASCKSKLKKIYFQDPHDDGKRLINLFDLNANTKKNIIPIREVDTYFIPRDIQF